MELRQLMTGLVYCLPPSATVREAAKLMRWANIGAVPICDADRLVGIVTDRDLLTRVIAADLDPDHTLLAEVMTPEIVTCFDDEDVEVAVDKMAQSQVRRIPVLDRRRRVIGILSLGDVAVGLQENELTGEILQRVSEPADSVR